MIYIAEHGGFDSIKTRADAEKLADEMLADIDKGFQIGTDLWRIWAQLPPSTT
jgi:hypothetical protein